MINVNDFISVAKFSLKDGEFHVELELLQHKTEKLSIITYWDEAMKDMGTGEMEITGDDHERSSHRRFHTLMKKCLNDHYELLIGE